MRLAGGCWPATTAPTHLEADGSFAPPSGPERHSVHGCSAPFAELAVDATLGLVRVRCVVGLYDAGRIISPQLADSQALGTG